jgi:hypothetical protein
MTSMKGNRVDWNASDTVDYPFPKLKPGEYGKSRDGVWYCCAPSGSEGLFGDLRLHTVVEHEDGMITVTPSILITVREKGVDVQKWHGYLTRGEWREA